MIRKLCIVAIPLMIGSTACAEVNDSDNGRELVVDPVAQAMIVSSDGQTIGEAILFAEGQHMRLQVDVRGLTEGVLGMHLHTTGLCQGPEFLSAGGHLNPDNREHGIHNPQGSHLGDLPNLVVSADGTASATISLPGSPAELEPILFDTDGTSIVIHAEADDLVTDPTGNSGPRIACGVLERS